MLFVLIKRLVIRELLESWIGVDKSFFNFFFIQKHPTYINKLIHYLNKPTSIKIKIKKSTQIEKPYGTRSILQAK